MRRFLIGEIQENQSEILVKGSQANHLKNVLRMKKDSSLILLDGAGNEYNGVIRGFHGLDVTIGILGKTENKKKDSTYISVAFGFLKESKVDDMIRPLTELGVNEILPFISDRSISRPDKDKIDKKMERWRKIASEAIKQCQRNMPPEIIFIPSFTEILRHSSLYTKKIMFYEKDRSSSLLRNFTATEHTKPEKAIILIGPEGGFSENEADLAKINGFESFTLSSGILRAETAIISSAAIVQYIYNV